MTVRIFKYLAICLFAFGLCPTSASLSAESDKVRLFWPPPPNAPRMEYGGLFESEDHFHKPWHALVNQTQHDPSENIEKLNYPAGVAALEDGTLLVAEALGKTVKKLDFNGKRVKDFFEVGSPFGELSDIALDPDKNVYVVDREKATVHVFDLEMK
ncbi:MAG: hypothetical protein C0614_12750, partial [Desulfuromonas sp.]